MTQFTEELTLVMEFCALTDRCQNGGQSTHFALKPMKVFEELVLKSVTNEKLKDMLRNSTS